MKFLLLAATILLSIHFGQAQNHFELVQGDSTSIDSYLFGNPLVFQGRFLLFDADSMMLYKFSESFEEVDSIRFYQQDLKVSNRANPAVIFIIDGSYLILSSSRKNLLRYGLDGQFIEEIQLDLKYKNQNYWIDDMRLSAANSLFNAQSKTIFLRIVPSNSISTTNDKYYKSYFRKKYEQKGIVGEFNLEGKLIKVFGNYDSVYQKKVFISHLDDSFFDKYSENEFIYTNQLSDKIHIENLDRNNTKTFGQRGKFINSNYNELLEIHSHEESFLNETSNLIQSPYYSSLNVTDNYIIRTYTIAINDTVNVSPNDIETRKKWLNGEIKGCLLRSKSELNQIKLWLHKPYFIQIYDVKTLDLLFDGPAGIGYPMLICAKQDKLYFYKGIDKRNVYEYQIRKILSAN